MKKSIIYFMFCSIVALPACSDARNEMSDKWPSPDFIGTYIFTADDEWVDLINTTGRYAQKITTIMGRKRDCINENDKNKFNIVDVSADKLKYIINRHGKVNENPFSSLHKMSLYKYPEETQAHIADYGEKQSWYCKDDEQEVYVRSEDYLHFVKPKKKLAPGVYGIHFYHGRYLIRVK